MRTIRQIIVTHAVLLALFAGAAFALAQETAGEPSVPPPAETNGLRKVDSYPPAPGPCQHDPYPSDAPNTDVPCDSPSCNVGPCTQPSQKQTVPAQDPAVPVIETEDIQTFRQSEPEKTRPIFEKNNEERRIALRARAQERLTNLAANVSNRMDAVVARFENIIGRLEARVEKLEALGVDTTEAKKSLDQAKASVAEAKDTLRSIDDLVTEAVGSEDIRSKWKAVRDTYATVRSLLREAHGSLRNTVALLKDAVEASPLGQGVSNAVRNENSLGNNNASDNASAPDAGNQ